MMQPQTANKLEVWQRGPIDGVPALLQPVAHALLQAQEELHIALHQYPEEKLWLRPAKVASVGFHLQHLSGVLDRVFTYACGQALSAFQLQQLQEEDVPNNTALSLEKLMARFDDQVITAIHQLKNTAPALLTEYRGVGRQQLPSTVIGLLVHGAEHTMRHLGQLMVTAKILQASIEP